MVPVHQVILKFKKDQYTVFSKTKCVTRMKAQINGSKLHQVSCTNFLGVQIDDTLGWQENIAFANVKMCKIIGILYDI